MQSIIFLYTVYHIIHRDFLSFQQTKAVTGKQNTDNQENLIIASNKNAVTAKQSMTYLQEYLIYFCVDHRPNLRCVNSSVIDVN